MKETMDMLGSFTDERVQSSTVMRKGNQAVFLPHQRSFAGLNNWLSRTYRFTFDEALKRDYNSAKAMLNDAFIQGLLRNRILPTCKSPWRIKASGPGASQEIEHFYESALKQIPLWHDFRRNLLMSVWHGRYGIQVAYDSISHDYREFVYEGRPINTVSHWIPHSGDKITFTWDGVPGIRINPMFVGSWQQRYGATVLQPGDERLAPESYQYRWTEEGPIMLLDTPEVRRKFIVPVFEVTDAPWDEPDMAGGVRGVGLRHYAFWAWDQRQEVVSWAMLHLEDFGAGGYTIVAYDGKEALARNIEAFKDPERRVIHIPVIPGNDERVTDMVTRLTPAGEGNDAIFQWAESYFNAHLTILFTGHPLNSQAAPTGMGSDMAGKSTEILKSIQRSDAEVSDCAITQELMPELVQRNDKGARYQLEFISSVRDADKQQRIDAAKKHYDMGGKVPTRYSHMLAEVPEPEDGEECLQNPSFQQQQVDPITGQPIQQQQPQDGGAVQAMKQKGGKHADKLGDIFRRSRQVTLDDARQALQQAGVPDEDIMAAIAFGVRTAAVIEIDTEGGVTYERGPGAWPELAGSEGNTVAAYSMDADPGSKWEAIEAPIKGGTRWRNIETGTITYVQPSAGRAVQALPGSTEHPGRTIERGEAGKGVALLPGKGLATSGVEQRVEMLAGGSVRNEAHVLEEVRNVDRRLLKKQTVALAGRLGLGVSSRTSKTEAMAYIEDRLRSRIGAKEEKPKADNAKQHIEEGIKAGKLSPEAGKAATQALEQHGKGKAIQEHFTEGVKAGKLQPEEAKVAIEAASNASKPAGETIDQGDKATSNKEAMALPTGTDGATQGASPADRKTAEETFAAGLSRSPIPQDDDEETETTEAGKQAAASYEGDAAARDRAKAEREAPRADGETLKRYLKRIGKDEHHDSLLQYARSKHRQEREDSDYHNSAIKQALEGLAFEQGTKKFNMTDARKTGDFTTIKGFDTVARSVAMNHPGLFSGMDAGKNYEGEETGLSQGHQQKLWDMLTEGKKQYRTLREHEDAAIAEHHEAGWPTIEKDEADPRRAKGEAAEEDADADTSFDFGANSEGEKQTDQFAPGAVHEIEARGNMRGFKAKFFESKKEGHIGIGYHDGEESHATMPIESAKHFVNDLQGKVDLPANSGHEVVDAVASGKGLWLGKGNDGVTFKVGDKVAKMSTTVPFQPFNPGHRTPEEAKQHIKRASEVNNKLIELGVPGLLKSEYVEHGDKAFDIKDHLEMPEKLTEEQLLQVRHTMDRMHEEGYVLGDEVQAGVKDGKAYLFDLGNAQKARDDRDYEDDSNRFQRFSVKNGGEELPLHKEGQAGLASADATRELYGGKVPKHQEEYEDRMRKGVEASKRARELGWSEKTSSGFMEQEAPGKYAPEHMEELKGQSFTNDKGLTVDLRKEEDGTWSVGSQKGLTQAGAAKALNKMGAEKAKGLFGDEVTAQADVEKPKQKLEWAEPTKRKDDGAELPGMRDTFAPGMFGRAATEADASPPRGGEEATEPGFDAEGNVATGDKGKKPSTLEERKQQKASEFIDKAVEKVHQRALKETGEVNHRRLEYLADSHWLNTADNQHDYLDSKEYKQKVVDAVAAKMGIERPTAETLDDHGLYREFNGRHQYKFSNDSGWKTANSKEDAIEQATSTYYGMTKSERKTKAQRAQEADDQLYKRLDATHGNMTKEQLDARIDELKGIAGATRANEFNGMGGRSSRKAMANEAARDAGQEALQLNIYREMKHGKREEAPQASEPQAPQEAPIEQAPPRGGIDHEEVGRKLRGATKDEAIGILKGVMEEHGVQELPTSALQLISRAAGHGDIPAQFSNNTALNQLMGRIEEKANDPVEQVKAQLTKAWEDESHTPEKHKEHFENFLANSGKIKASLQKKTVEQLKKEFPAPYPPKTKAEAVENAYNNLLHGFNLEGTVSYNPFEPNARVEAIRGKVNAITQETIQKAQAKERERVKEYEARRNQFVKAFTNPETDEEIVQHVEKFGKGKDKPEIMRKYDAIKAKSAWEKQQAESKQKFEERQTVRPVGESGAGGVTRHKTRHTKTGEELHVVRLENKVEREEYNQHLRNAKALGGWYSSFRGAGAIPGFTFKSQEAADKFQATVSGQEVKRDDTTHEQATEQKKQLRMQALQDRAVALREQGAEKDHYDGKENTARRSRMADSRRAEGQWLKRKADTLENIAQAVEEGKAEYLSGLRDAAQVDALHKRLQQAKQQRRQAMKPEERERQSYEDFEAEPHGEHDIAHATLFDKGENGQPVIKVREWMKHAAERLGDVPGYKRISADIKKGKDIPASKLADVKDLASQAMRRGESQARWLHEHVMNIDRLQRAGITSDSLLREALRQYVPLVGKKQEKDPIREAEKKVRFMKKVGFFPTPRAVIDRMIEEADIQPDHSILEPSAGMGSILDAVHEQFGEGVKSKGYETDADLHGINKLKGHDVEHGDFMSQEPKANYDRVLMNPPFEAGQDAEHVMRAYEHLAPGGKMVAVMSEGPFFRQDKRSQAFREWLGSKEHYHESMDNAFKGQDVFRETGVKTRLVTIHK